MSSMIRSGGWVAAAASAWLAARERADPIATLGQDFLQQLQAAGRIIDDDDIRERFAIWCHDGGGALGQVNVFTKK
jgi:hypothetical protein